MTQGVQQNLTTTVTDVNGHQITGLTLDYQSTNPLDITAGAAGAVTASFPGSASVYAICQPSTCNPSPINEVGVNGTGLSISSNPVDITTPGTASSFVWYASPGQSQYMVQVELLSGTVGSTIRLPYVPNSMVMDQTGTNLYFGSARELMVFSTATNSLASQNSSVPGVVLSVSPNNSTVVINDQSRHLFYIYSPAGTGTVAETFGGMGNAARLDARLQDAVYHRQCESEFAGFVGRQSAGHHGTQRHALRLQREHRLDHLPIAAESPACQRGTDERHTAECHEPVSRPDTGCHGARRGRLRQRIARRRHTLGAPAALPATTPA